MGTSWEKVIVGMINAPTTNTDTTHVRLMSHSPFVGFTPPKRFQTDDKACLVALTIRQTPEFSVREFVESSAVMALFYVAATPSCPVIGRTGRTMRVLRTRVATGEARDNRRA